MDRVGSHFPAANTEPEAMATLAAGAHEVMGFDSVMPIFSIAQEATALGCEVDWSDSSMMPTPSTHPWEDRSVEIRLPDGFPDSFLEDKYVKCAVEAIRLLKQHFGDEVMILGKVMGPWTLSYHLYNVQEFLYDTLIDPDRVRQSLDTLKQVPVICAKAQLEAGADAIVWADHATGGLVRNTMYRDFLLPHHQELIPQVPAPVILHCCGPTLDRIQFFREAGFAAFHFESQVAPDKAMAETAGKIKLAGNINNPVTLFSRGPAEVRLEAQRAIDTSRGPVIDEAALVQALTEKWIAGAGLDVLTQEPGDPANPLFGRENVIITPHASFYSETAIEELEQKAAKRVAQALRGETPTNVVNPGVMQQANHRFGSFQKAG